MTEFTAAINRADFDKAFDELALPELRVENRSRSAFPDRSAAELRTSWEQLRVMVASVREWVSVVCWLSPTWFVGRHEREAVGHDGERYTWTRVLVIEVRDGRLASMCDFDVEDEERAFAYAEERIRAVASRLALTNRCSETILALTDAGRAKDIDAMFGYYSDRFTYDDRRRLSGDPVPGGAALRLAQSRILEQYNSFDGRTLAVRGERLHLGWGRWSNDAGYETAQLFLHGLDQSGRIECEGRFDEDDFEGAYRELERRYYAGEGAAYAEPGATLTDIVIATNRGEFDRVFGELSAPGLRFDSRSGSVFPDRTAAEVRASIRELNAMVTSIRQWDSAVHWLSCNWVVARQEREARGRDDGEKFAWTRLYVGEIRDRLVMSICSFDVEDEDAAFAYAAERVRATDVTD